MNFFQFGIYATSWVIYRCQPVQLSSPSSPSRCCAVKCDTSWIEIYGWTFFYVLNTKKCWNEISFEFWESFFIISIRCDFSSEFQILLIFYVNIFFSYSTVPWSSTTSFEKFFFSVKLFQHDAKHKYSIWKMWNVFSACFYVLSIGHLTWEKF